MIYNTKYASYNAAIDASIDTLMIEKEIHPLLREAMRYSLFAGGKRFRPILALAVAEFFGVPSSAVMPFAVGIEMIHTYTLIHDDLPCMDNDDLRRGKPTSHKKFGEANAILAGDSLLNYAFEVMIEGALSAENSKQYYKALSTLAYAAGPSCLLSGQVADLQNENNPNVGEAELRYIHKNKTGALICASVLSGAYIGTDDEKIIERFKVYGEQIGLAFQIADDILDVTGDQVTLGKTIGKDDQANKLTFVKIFGIEKSREMALDCTEKAVEAISELNGDSQFLCEMARFVTRRTK